MQHEAVSDDVQNGGKEEVASVKPGKIHSNEAFRISEEALRDYILKGLSTKYTTSQENLGIVYDISEEETKANKRSKPQERKIVESLTNWLVCEQRMYVEKHCSRIITTDQDKLYRCLSKHLKGLSAKRNWVAPFGILTAIVITITTSAFKPVLGIEPDTWFAIFVIGGLVTFLWFAWSLCRDLASRDIDGIIEDIINDLSMFKNQY